MPYKTRAIDWYSRAIHKWILMLADEIEGMTRDRDFKKSVKSGALQDALVEIRRVLILANMDDLAYEAQELKRIVDEIASRILVREGAYYQQVAMQNLRENIQKFIERAKKRAAQRAEPEY